MSGKRQGPTRAVVLVVVLLVLAGLVVGADRVAQHYAENRVAGELQSAMGTEERPTVSIEGFPFLTQVAAHHFRQVDVTAFGVTGTDASGSKGVEVATLQTSLYDVRTSEHYQRITADRLAGQATLAYSALDAFSTTPISFAGSEPNGQGRIKATVSTAIDDKQLSVTLTGTVGVDEPNQALVITAPAIQVAGITLSQPVVAALADQFLKPVPVGALPLGVRLVGVTPTASGIVAEVAGTDVVVSG